MSMSQDARAQDIAKTLDNQLLEQLEAIRQSLNDLEVRVKNLEDQATSRS